MQELMQICVYAIGVFFGWLIASTIDKRICKHKWKHIDTIGRTGKSNGSINESVIYVMQCENCGKIKSKEIK